MDTVESRRATFRIVFALACLATMLPALHAAEPRIGLVLGGGGARGAAHIGVLKVLERERIPIHAIAGTSMGAIVGAAYAAGYSPEEIESLIGSVDWSDVFHDATPRAETPMRQKQTDVGIVSNLAIGLEAGRLHIPGTLIRGQKLDLLLRRIFLGRSKLASFDELPIPFRGVATELSGVTPVVLDSGDLETAVRASMSVPGYFSPVERNGQTLVDGGVVNNVPIDVARAMGATHLIVVNVGSPTVRPITDAGSGPAVILHLLGGLTHQRTETSLATLAADDVLLQPELADMSAADFAGAAGAIGPGERAAFARVEELRRFAVPQAQYSSWQATQRRRFDTETPIDSVVVETNHSRTWQFVRDRIDAKPGKALDIDHLEEEIRGAYGRGTYEYINYHLAQDPAGGTALHVQPVDSSLGRVVFRLGAQISDDFNGRDEYQLDLEARLTGITAKGGEWRNFVSLGRVLGVETDLYLPFGNDARWFVSPSVGYAELDQPLVVDGATFAQYRVGSWSSALRLGRDFGSNLQLSTALLWGHDRATRNIALPILPPTVTAELGGLGATLLWDNLDNVRFPRRGLRAELSFTAFDTALGDFDGEMVRVAVDQALSTGANTLLVGARASLASQAVDAFQTDATLGGLTFLSGYGNRELEDRQMLLLRAIYYRRISRQRMLLDLPVYLGTSLEGGNVWSRYADVSLDDLQGAASLFLGLDLPIGPLQLGYGRNFNGGHSFHLTFSSLVLPRYR